MTEQKISVVFTLVVLINTIASKMSVCDKLKSDKSKSLCLSFFEFQEPMCYGTVLEFSELISNQNSKNEEKLLEKIEVDFVEKRNDVIWWDYRKSKYGWNRGSRFLYQVKFEGQRKFNLTVSSKYFKRHFKMILVDLFQVPEIYRNWIHVIHINGRSGKDDEGSGGGANWRHGSLNVNIDYAMSLLKMDALEEFFIHEGVHGNIELEQFIRRQGIRWRNAIKMDRGRFLSVYARENAKSEDIAESFLGWLMVKKYNGMTNRKVERIKELIPNRLKLLDDLFMEASGVLVN